MSWPILFQGEVTSDTDPATREGELLEEQDAIEFELAADKLECGLDDSWQDDAQQLAQIHTGQVGPAFRCDTRARTPGRIGSTQSRRAAGRAPLNCLERQTTATLVAQSEVCSGPEPSGP